MEIEEKNIAIDPTCADNLALRNHKVEISSSADNNEEEITCSAANWKRQKLFLEIPTTKIMDIKPKRVNFVLTPNSSGSDMKSHELGATASASNASSAGSSVIKGQGQGQGRSSSGLKSLLPKLGFVYRSSSDVEKASCDVPFTTLGDQMSSIPRSTSLTKLFTPRIGRTSSLPLDNPASIIPNTTGSLHPSANGAQMHEAQVHISRSVSAPLNKELKLKRTDSFIRVIPSPKVKARELQIPSANEPVDTENAEADTEDIPEEDAVCRICMVELCEGGETLKMECSCKGELALAHQECAVKWFSIKGNKTCDICKQDVTNLPVTLLRIQSTRAANSATTRAQMIDINDYRAWQEVPILVIVSMLAYFCFLEQLLVARMGTNAIAISLPFSCVLGLLSSMTSSTMVTKRFVWIYASLQFSLVVIFGHIFYSVVHLQAIISILLATFVGYGTAMSGSSITVEFLRWRRRNTQQRARQDPQMAVANNQHDQNSENPEMLV